MGAILADPPERLADEEANSEVAGLEDQRIPRSLHALNQTTPCYMRKISILP